MAKRKKRTLQFVKSKEQLLKEQEQNKKRALDIEQYKKQKEQRKKYVIYGSILAVLILMTAIGMRTYVNRTKTEQWDDFAKCLTEKGAVMYGNMQTCKYTQHQAGMFGSSFKYLNYKDFSENSDVRITPTWYINGEKLEGEQSFETLAEKTGCKIY
jgi:hypothetical protein